jgi:hypothetical protein
MNLKRFSHFVFFKSIAHKTSLVLQLLCCISFILINGKLKAKEGWDEKTKRYLNTYDTLLKQAESNSKFDSVLSAGLRKELKFSKSQVFAALPQLDTILAYKHKPSQTKELLNSVYDSAYFTRNFNGPYGTTMVYRFSKPNAWGMGLAYLSDRYNNAYFLKQIAQNSYSFINDSIIYFVRIYYLHGDSINILGSNMDMYERKVFAPLESNHNWFEKKYTYYSRNNDRIENLNYHFSLNYYANDSKKLGNLLATQVESKSLSTSDVENFVEYNSLKKLNNERHLEQAAEFLDTTKLCLDGSWFYIGTINKAKDWTQNFTHLKVYDDLLKLLKDTSKHINAIGILYARDKPPQNYSPEQTKAQSKGKIVGSIYPKDDVFISAIREVVDFKSNISLWVQIRRIKRWKQ